MAKAPPPRRNQPAATSTDTLPPPLKPKQAPRPKPKRSEPGVARAVPHAEAGLPPIQAPRVVEQAVPGRARQAAAASIRTLNEVEACCMRWLAVATDRDPIKGGNMSTLENHVADVCGAPCHDAIEKLFLLGGLLETPVSDNGIAMRANLKLTERGLALADMYEQGKLLPLRDPNAPPTGIRLPGDLKEGEKFTVARDSRPAPDPTYDVGAPRAVSPHSPRPEPVIDHRAATAPIYR